ncbi:MAG: T9SS type A sorting domain-containing protein [Cytophagales bacterium]|nr:T9SS type A sorting domain-containing protein [Cytophagales bacterium]
MFRNSFVYQGMEQFTSDWEEDRRRTHMVFVQDGDALGVDCFNLLDAHSCNYFRLSSSSGGLIDLGLDRAELLPFLRYRPGSLVLPIEDAELESFLDLDLEGDPDDKNPPGDTDRDIGSEEFQDPLSSHYPFYYGLDDSEIAIGDQDIVFRGLWRTTDEDDIIVHFAGYDAENDKYRYEGEVLSVEEDGNLEVEIPVGAVGGVFRIGLKKDLGGSGTDVDSDYNYYHADSTVRISRRYYVDSGVGDENLGVEEDSQRSGLDWPNAFKSLQTALFIAGPGSEIWIAEGVYYPQPYINDYAPTFVKQEASDPRKKSSIYFRSLSGVSLYGGFASIQRRIDDSSFVLDRGDRSDARPMRYRTVLSGDIDRTSISTHAGKSSVPVLVWSQVDNDLSGNTYHVLDIKSNESLTLDGLILTGGNASSSSGGGGLRVVFEGSGLGDNGVRLEIFHVAFIANKASKGGGALLEGARGDYGSGHGVRISHSIFTENEGGANGQGLFVSDFPEVEIVNCTFFKNESTDPSNGILAVKQSGVGTSSHFHLFNTVFYENYENGEVYSGAPVSYNGSLSSRVQLNSNASVSSDRWNSNRNSDVLENAENSLLLLSDCPPFENIKSLGAENYLVPSVNSPLKDNGYRGLPEWVPDRDLLGEFFPYSSSGLDVGAFESQKDPSSSDVFQVSSFSPTEVVVGHHTLLRLRGSGFGSDASLNKVTFLSEPGFSDDVTASASSFESSGTELVVSIPNDISTGGLKVSNGPNEVCLGTVLTVETFEVVGVEGTEDPSVVSGFPYKLPPADKAEPNLRDVATLPHTDISLGGVYPSSTRAGDYRVLFTTSGGAKLEGDITRLREFFMDVRVPNGALDGVVEVVLGETDTDAGLVELRGVTRNSIKILTPEIHLVYDRSDIRFTDAAGPLYDDLAVFQNETEFFLYAENVPEGYLEEVFLVAGAGTPSSPYLSITGARSLDRHWFLDVPSSGINDPNNQDDKLISWSTVHNRLESVIRIGHDGVVLPYCRSCRLELVFSSGEKILYVPPIEVLPKLSVPPIPPSYRGQEISLSVVGFSQVDPSLNQVNFGAVPASITGVFSDRIDLRIPDQASSGDVEFRVGVGPIVVSSFSLLELAIGSLSPSLVYVGDALRIGGEHFPVSPLEGTVTFLGDESDSGDDVSVRGVSSSNDKFLSISSVPVGSRSGRVSLRVFSSLALSPGGLNIYVPLRLGSSSYSGYVGELLSISAEGLPDSDLVSILVGFSSVAGDVISVPGSLSVDGSSFEVLVPVGAVDGDIEVSVLGRQTRAGFNSLVPVISGFSTTSLREGDMLTIRGSNFSRSGVNEVVFLGGLGISDDRRLLGLSSSDGGVLDVVVPAGSVSGHVSVRVYGSESRSSEVLSILPGDYVSGAVLSSVEPPEAFVGSVLSLIGKFSGVLNSVEFPIGEGRYVSVPASFPVLGDASELEVVVPSSAISGELRVVPSGTPALRWPDYKILPILRVVDIPSGYVGEELSLRGSGFTQGNRLWNRVIFSSSDGSDALGEIRGVSEDELRVLVPSAAISGPVRVEVHGLSVGGSFELLVPEIESFSPGFAFSGVRLRLRGSGFSPREINYVSFLGSETDDLDDVSVLVSGDLTDDGEVVLTLEVPDAARTGRLSVDIFGSRSLSSGILTVLESTELSRVVIGGFSPEVLRPGDKLTISGLFSDSRGNIVSFTDGEGRFISVPGQVEIGPSGAATGLSVRIPPQARSGKFSVSVPSNENILPAESTDALTIIIDPIIEDYSPARGISGDRISILGSHFARYEDRILVEFDKGFGLVWRVARVLSVVDDKIVVSLPPGLPVGRVHVRIQVGDIRHDFERLFRVLDESSLGDVLVFDSVLGLEGDFSDVAVYPNPVLDKLYIDTNAVGLNLSTISVYDILGRLVLRSALEDLDQSGDVHILDVQVLTPAAYVLVLSTPEKENYISKRINKK